MTHQIDTERVQAITTLILKSIRGNVVRGPESRDRSLEALNALAACSALVLLGCDGPEGEARKFFDSALKENLEQLSEDFLDFLQRN